MLFFLFFKKYFVLSFFLTLGTTAWRQFHFSLGNKNLTLLDDKRFNKICISLVS